MMKNPAFLFYSNDFYEGTRLMLPEERACYVDLMIYQHQHGFIPDDKRRIMMYCSGIDEATLEATLKAKFKLCDKGWYNERLQNVIEERQEYKNKQSDNGLIGQFFKKAKASLKAKEIKCLKDFIYTDFGKENLINELKKEGATHEATLEGLLKHLENENINEDLNIDIEERENKIKEIKRKFYDSLVGFVPKYGKETIREFYEYWSEPTKSKTQIRYQLERTWDLTRRLNTWVKNQSKWDNNFQKEDKPVTVKAKA